MASVVSALLALLILASSPAAAQTYTVKRVTLGGSWTELGGPRAINSRGHVVGVGQLPGSEKSTPFIFDGTTYLDLGVYGAYSATALDDGDRVVGSTWDHSPYLWSPSEGFQRLTPPHSGFGVDLNSVGTVVGIYFRDAAVWTRATGMTLVAGDGIHCCASATRVNESDQVIGYWYTHGRGEAPRGFYWDRATGFRDLVPPYVVGYFVRAIDINDAGIVLVDGIKYFPYVSQGQEPYALYLFSAAGGYVDTGVRSKTNFGLGRINAAGQVAATRYWPNGRAFIWSREFGLTDLWIEGREYSKVEALNDAGEVVGIVSGDPRPVPFIYKNGAMHLLDALLPPSDAGTIVQSHAITNRGVIAARTVDNHIALLTPPGPPPIHEFQFTGFHGIGNPPVLNEAKAGSAVPVKFGLGGNRGVDAFAPGYPRSAPGSCSDPQDISFAEQTLSAGSGLSYARGADQYTYTWKTDKSWAGSCRTLVLLFTDGTEARALFRFR